MPGPKLPKIKTGGKVTKGYIQGVQGGDRNDVRKPYGGLKKASTRKTNSVNA
tara:strand:+ start:246 stop:401 length:156 start_codon:yes stop_codon:yes gene_type:complete